MYYILCVELLNFSYCVMKLLLLLLLLVLGRFYPHSTFKGLNFKDLVCKDNFKDFV